MSTHTQGSHNHPIIDTRPEESSKKLLTFTPSLAWHFWPRSDFDCAFTYCCVVNLCRHFCMCGFGGMEFALDKFIDANDPSIICKSNHPRLIWLNRDTSATSRTRIGLELNQCYQHYRIQFIHSIVYVSQVVCTITPKEEHGSDFDSFLIPHIFSLRMTHYRQRPAARRHLKQTLTQNIVSQHLFTLGFVEIIRKMCYIFMLCIWFNETTEVFPYV